MKRNRFLAIALAIVIVIALLPTSALAATYGDTGGHWAEDSIERWTQYGIVQGQAGMFRPDDQITRAEFAVLLDNVMRFEKTLPENPFNDLSPDNFAYDSILRLAAAGYMQGDGSGNVMPGAVIDRESAFVLLARIFGIASDAEALATFPDADAVSDWARGEVGGLINAGYVQGDENGYLNPRAPLTRAQGVRLIDNIIKAFYHEPGSYTPGEVSGIIVVNTQGVTLDGLIADGKLVVTQGVGDGGFTLSNSSVNSVLLAGGRGGASIENSVVGTLTVSGDGIKTDIDPDSTVNSIVLNGAGTEVLAEGVVNNVTVNADDADISGGGFVETVEFMSGSGGAVSVPGATASVSGNAGEVAIPGGTVAPGQSVQIPAEDTVVRVSVTAKDGKTTLTFEGDTTELIANVVVKGSASQDVTWSSGSESVATVTSDGLVTAVSNGTAVITATSVFDAQKSGSITITVDIPAPDVITHYLHQGSEGDGDYAIVNLSAGIGHEIDTQAGTVVFTVPAIKNEFSFSDAKSGISYRYARGESGDFELSLIAANINEYVVGLNSNGLGAGIYNNNVKIIILQGTDGKLPLEAMPILNTVITPQNTPADRNLIIDGIYAENPPCELDFGIIIANAENVTVRNLKLNIDDSSKIRTPAEVTGAGNPAYHAAVYVGGSSEGIDIANIEIDIDAAIDEPAVTSNPGLYGVFVAETANGVLIRESSITNSFAGGLVFTGSYGVWTSNLPATSIFSNTLKAVTALAIGTLDGVTADNIQIDAQNVLLNLADEAGTALILSTPGAALSGGALPADVSEVELTSEFFSEPVVALLSSLQNSGADMVARIYLGSGVTTVVMNWNHATEAWVCTSFPLAGQNGGS